MTDREKLKALLVEACRFECSGEFCKKWSDACVGRTADYLLAKGINVPSKQIETNIYDSEEIHHNCTVQILHNSVTGEQSIGWWKEDEQRWNSVEDRLPENGRYLVFQKSFISGGHCDFATFTQCYSGLLGDPMNGKQLWYKYDGEYGDYEVTNVTHWMPLPEPPKET